MKNKSDQLQIGEKYKELEIKVSPQLNEQFMKALDDFNPRYKEIVHPGLLLNISSITKSPSFYLDKDVAAVGAKFSGKYRRPVRVGETVVVSWRVTDVYERRSRNYQICDVLITDDMGQKILSRKICNTFIGGKYLKKRVKWEKETGYQREVSIHEVRGEGYEIVGGRKELTLRKQRYYSGGMMEQKGSVRNIHTDRETSIRSGIGRAIASGLMFESYLVELMIKILGETWFYVGETDVVGIEMAGDGDTITPKAVIKSKDFAVSTSTIDFDIWCENQNGIKVMVGSSNYRGDLNRVGLGNDR